MGVLRYISGEYGGEKHGGNISNYFSLLFWDQSNSAAQSDLDDPGVNDGIVFFQRHPIGHLRFKVFPCKSEVADAGK